MNNEPRDRRLLEARREGTARNGAKEFGCDPRISVQEARFTCLASGPCGQSARDLLWGENQNVALPGGAPRPAAQLMESHKRDAEVRFLKVIDRPSCARSRVIVGLEAKVRRPSTGRQEDMHGEGSWRGVRSLVIKSKRNYLKSAKRPGPLDYARSLREKPEPVPGSVKAYATGCLELEAEEAARLSSRLARRRPRCARPTPRARPRRCRRRSPPAFRAQRCEFR